MADNKSLSFKYQQALRDQEIDENGPGTILKDFEILLDFVRSGDMPVSGIHNLLPLKLLGELNALLTHPIEIDLKRPQQKSYPNIHGLYLLLRASGLSLVRRNKKKPRLVLDDTALQSWKELNSTERYFILLETWMIRGQPQIIGEERGLFSTWIPECMRFYKRIPGRGLNIDGNRDEDRYITYSIGSFGIALMELFGFISLKRLKPLKGKGWRFAGARRTAFGKAILRLLYDAFYREPTLFLDHIDEPDKSMGTIRPAITPYFPQWKNNLSIPEHAFEEGTFIFKVSLWRDCWRRIALPGEMYLDNLSFTILDAFKFDHDHLDMFTYKNRFGIQTHVCHPYMDEEPLRTNEVLIGELPIQPGDVMTYLFDFGDKWEFDVELERVDPVDPHIKKPLVIESDGEAPEQYPIWDKYD